MFEQISLFGGLTMEDFAEILCDEYNKLDTVWKGTFKVARVELNRWYHITDENKILEVDIKPELGENYLMQFKGDKHSQDIIYNADMYSSLLARLCEDKDFAICTTPWSIYIYFHKYELKDLQKYL